MRYFPQFRDQDYTIRLIVENDKNCRDTAEHRIKAARSCFVEVAFRIFRRTTTT